MSEQTLERQITLQRAVMIVCHSDDLIIYILNKNATCMVKGRQAVLCGVCFRRFQCVIYLYLGLHLNLMDSIYNSSCSLRVVSLCTSSCSLYPFLFRLMQYMYCLSQCSAPEWACGTMSSAEPFFFVFKYQIYSLADTASKQCGGPQCLILKIL